MKSCNVGAVGVCGSSGSSRIAERSDVGRSLLVLGSAYVCLIALTIGFLQQWSPSLRLAMGVITAATGTIVLVKNKAHFCYFIISSSLLGPVLKSSLAGVGMVNIGDFFLTIMALGLCRMWSENALRPNPYRNYFYVMAVCTITNILVSGNASISISGILNMMEIAIVYVFTFSVIRSREQARSCINAMVFGVILSALVHVYSYAQGNNLNLGWSEDMALSATSAISGWEDSPFIKTSFFYGNLSITCSIVAVIGLRFVLLSPRAQLRSTLLWTCAISIALISGSLTGRTPLVVTAFVGLWLLSVAAYKLFLSRERVPNIFMGTFVAIIVAYVLLFNFRSLIVEKQQDAYLTMFTEEGSESMQQRFSMWEAAFHKPFLNPKEFLFGVGPNANLQITKFGIMPEGYVFSVDTDPIISFHQFFIDVIFQLGIFFGISLILLTLKTLKSLQSLLQNTRYNDELAFDCTLGIIAFILTGFTLGASWSKPYIVVAQLFAISHLLVLGCLDQRPAGEPYPSRIKHKLFRSKILSSSTKAVATTSAGRSSLLTNT